MEWVDGETLHARVRRAGGLSVGAVLEIGAQVAGALAAAEARGLTHRDLKPANLMLVTGADINVKVIDFGLAKAASADADDRDLTRTAEFVGTPAFASPEQFDGHKDVDARSDFYALGATLWYALTGKAPFAGHTVADIHEQQVNHPLPLAQLRAVRAPRPVIDLLRSLLSPDAGGRPQTTEELTGALTRCQDGIAAVTTADRRRSAAATAISVGVLLVLGFAGWQMYEHTRPAPVSRPVPAPAVEKSIAVLPFDNLSEDKSNAFFANGVQDEILTDLARITALKVISRTSVLGYSDPAKRPPAREIGQALGVAYLLEGSVQRAGNRVRLSAQLIDVASDRHVWAETYDRELTDVFSIQSEVADTIAGKLQTQLSRTEKAAIDEPPTHDLAAYELYLHAKELIYNFDPNTSNWDSIREAARLLEEATSRDPDFYEAWYLLTNTYGNMLHFSIDPTPATRTLQAEKALATIRRLRPDSGDTHLAAALYYYNVGKPDQGRPELALAREKSPHNARVLYVTGSTGMIDNHRAEALVAMQQSRALNPRHVGTLGILINMYTDLRRYDDAKRVADEAIAAGINPDYFKLRHAMIVQFATGDTAEEHAVLRAGASASAPGGQDTILEWFIALLDRNFDEAVRVVAADPRQEFLARGRVIEPRAFLTGCTAYARGSIGAARKDFESVRPVFETAVRNRPQDAEAWEALADLDARLGRKDDALREGWRSVALVPISRDGAAGPPKYQDLAWIYAATGDKDRALDMLESLENVPAAYDYGYIGKHPDFDVFRGEPRFQAILQAIRKPVDLSKFNPADFPPPKVDVAP